MIWLCRLEAIFRFPLRIVAYTELLFDICQQFGIHYYTATPKERYFVEEVTRVTWAKQQEASSGVHQNIRPAFSA